MRVDGIDVEIEPIKPVEDGARFDISTEDDRRWRVDVDAAGNLDAIVATFVDDTLADIERPDWLEEAVARVRPPAHA
jgi:hypothetical protein